MKNRKSIAINIQILLCVFVSNVALTGIYFVIRHELFSLMYQIEGEEVCISVRDILSGLPVPLPTIPILVVIAVMSLLSSPLYFLERRTKELHIRLICGATRSELIKIIFTSYIVHIFISFIPCIIVIYSMELLDMVTILAFVALFLSEVIVGFIYFILSKRI